MRDGFLIGREVTRFLGQLAHESERAAVVMGGALVDESLEAALVKLLLPSKSKRDELFDPDQPIGSFRAKTRLAHRLGLVDDKFCSALDMLRRIRNDFAHSSESKTLNDAEHSDRVRQLKSYADRTPIWETLVKAASTFVSSAVLVDFVTTIAVMVTILKYLECDLQPISLRSQASFIWSTVGTDGIGTT